MDTKTKRPRPLGRDNSSRKPAGNRKPAAQRSNNATNPAAPAVGVEQCVSSKPSRARVEQAAVQENLRELREMKWKCQLLCYSSLSLQRHLDEKEKEQKALVEQELREQRGSSKEHPTDMSTSSLECSTPKWGDDASNRSMGDDTPCCSKKVLEVLDPFAKLVSDASGVGSSESTNFSSASTRPSGDQFDIGISSKDSPASQASILSLSTLSASPDQSNYRSQRLMPMVSRIEEAERASHGIEVFSIATPRVAEERRRTATTYCTDHLCDVSISSPQKVDELQSASFSEHVGDACVKRSSAGSAGSAACSSSKPKEAEGTWRPQVQEAAEESNNGGRMRPQVPWTTRVCSLLGSQPLPNHFEQVSLDAQKRRGTVQECASAESAIHGADLPRGPMQTRRQRSCPVRRDVRQLYPMAKPQRSASSRIASRSRSTKGFDICAGSIEAVLGTASRSTWLALIEETFVRLRCSVQHVVLSVLQATNLKVIHWSEASNVECAVVQAMMSWSGIRGNSVEEGEELVQCTLRMPCGKDASDGAVLCQIDGCGWVVVDFTILTSTWRRVGTVSGEACRQLLSFLLSGDIWEEPSAVDNP